MSKCCCEPVPPSEPPTTLPRLDMPWRLRRFATGLPKLAWPKSMIASVRFSGLEVDVGTTSPRTSGNLVGVVLEAPERSRCILCLDGFSMLTRGLWPKASARLWKVVFSWPKSVSRELGGFGVVFPASDVMLSARFSGLLGGRGRLVGLDEGTLGRADRRESLTPDRNGVANGVCDCGVAEGKADEVGTAVAEAAVFVWCGGQGDSGDGPRGRVTVSVGDAACARLNLDGDLDRDRRSDRTAEPTST